MKKDVITGIIILVLAILLLGFTFVVNVTNAFSFLDKPILGEGLGPLCSSLPDCQNFCLNSKGICNSYCRANPSNRICDNIK
ncbi:hypothetical protein J4429_04975 [Candidatus Pacearchaeota archaeon]|nr:hypothetical protein [Candidatus Pacearchaeota archaeon]